MTVTVSRTPGVVAITVEEAERFLLSLPVAGVDRTMDRSAVARILAFAEGAALAVMLAAPQPRKILEAGLRGLIGDVEKRERQRHEYALHKACAAVLRTYAATVRNKPSPEPLSVQLEALALLIEEDAETGRKEGR